MLHQQSERRGTLTSRVTSDVDQITQFLQCGGVMLLVSAGQIVVTTVVMAVYSWQLTLVVCAAFLPARRSSIRAASSAGWPPPTARSGAGRRHARRGRRERRRAPRSSGPTAWPAAPRRRLDDGDRDATGAPSSRALRTSVTSFSAGELAAGLATGRGGRRRRAARRRRRTSRSGELTAFLFLVDAVRPAGADRHRGAQRGAERGRRLAAGARRARHSSRTWPTRARPACDLPAGPIDVRFERRVASPTRAARTVLSRRRPGDRGADPGRGGRRDRLAARPRSPSC